MKEISFDIRGKHSTHQFSMTEYGRITCQEPFLTLTLSQYRTARLMALGLFYPDIGKLLHLKVSYLKQQVKTILADNKIHTKALLLATATELGLLKDMAAEEISFRSKEIVRKTYLIDIPTHVEVQKKVN